MRLAIFSDIHGNPRALEAVLDAVAGQVDGYVVVGDYCAIGYDPASVIDMLASLPNAYFVRGNTDRYTLTYDRPDPHFDDVVQDRRLLGRFMEVQASFAWTRGYLAAHQGHMAWLAALPLEVRLTLPDGTRLLAVHARPSHDEGDGFAAALSDAELYAMVADSGADIVVAGHYHMPFERTVQGIHCVNVASVSNPEPPDWRASYAVLDASPTGYQLTLHRVAYDYQAVRDAIAASHHPAADFLHHFWQK